MHVGTKVWYTTRDCGAVFNGWTDDGRVSIRLPSGPTGKARYAQVTPDKVLFSGRPLAEVTQPRRAAQSQLMLERVQYLRTLSQVAMVEEVQRIAKGLGLSEQEVKEILQEQERSELE